MRATLIVLASAGIVSAIAGCSSNEAAAPSAPSDAAVELTEEAPTHEDSGIADARAACTPKEKTGKKVCDDCLKQNCCEAINTCFADKDCTSMNTCWSKCYALGQTDAGAQCARQCGLDHPDSVKTFEGMISCQNDSCGKVCR